MRTIRPIETVFCILFIALSLESCGKKKPTASEAPPVSSSIPATWDVNADYPASALKAKDL